MDTSSPPTGQVSDERLRQLVRACEDYAYGSSIAEFYIDAESALRELQRLRSAPEPPAQQEAECPECGLLNASCKCHLKPYEKLAEPAVEPRVCSCRVRFVSHDACCDLLDSPETKSPQPLTGGQREALDKAFHASTEMVDEGSSVTKAGVQS